MAAPPAAIRRTRERNWVIWKNLTDLALLGCISDHLLQTVVNIRRHLSDEPARLRECTLPPPSRWHDRTSAHAAIRSAAEAGVFWSRVRTRWLLTQASGNLAAWSRSVF
jgi:hypothetical protein